MIKDTLYYGPADLAEQTLRVELNIPIGICPRAPTMQSGDPPLEAR